MPRTGTTVLQKHLFPKAKNHLVFQKQPYNKTSGKSLDTSLSVAGASAKHLVNQLSSVDPKEDPATFFYRFMLTPAGYAAENPKIDTYRQVFTPILIEVIKKLARLGQSEGKSIFISSERLCDNSASFLCDSRHTRFDWEFLYIPICNAISRATPGQALISTCFREPIKYLRSKYFRTFIQRRSMKSYRDLSPSEFIQKQATLEVNNPGTQPSLQRCMQNS